MVSCWGLTKMQKMFAPAPPLIFYMPHFAVGL